MGSLLSSNGCNSACFDNACLKFSAHGYFKVLFYSMWSKYISSKDIFMTSSLMNLLKKLQYVPILRKVEAFERTTRSQN